MTALAARIWADIDPRDLAEFVVTVAMFSAAFVVWRWVI